MPQILMEDLIFFCSLTILCVATKEPGGETVPLASSKSETHETLHTFKDK